MKLTITTVILIFSVLVTVTANAQRSSFSDVLDLKTEVKNARDILPSVFSDMGAWFAYALPADGSYSGGFTGPLIMDMNGRWLSKNFSNLTITTDDDVINLDGLVTSHYYPGLLVSEWKQNQLRITMQLIFVSGRQALIKTTIKNTGSKKSKIELDLTGELLLKDAAVSTTRNKITVDLLKTKNHFYIQYIDGPLPKIMSVDSGYVAHFEPVVLAPGSEYTIVQEQGYYPDTESAPARKYQAFQQVLKKNKERWDGYINKYFSHTHSLSLAEKRLAVKSMVTLNTNWRSPFKDIRHDGVFPSVNYQGFYGVWSWDSWKQAVGSSLFNPWLAQENIHCMFDYRTQQV